MKYIDAHAHVNFAQFDEDREVVLARAREAGVGMINVGTDRESSQRAVELAQGTENVWATVGLHPTDFAEGFDHEFYKNLANDKKVVAIGECGLDVFRAEAGTLAEQEKLFVAQINLANELNLPLMLHIRNAYEQAYTLVKEHTKVRGDVHFFAGSWDEAKKFLDLGFTLSFTGVVTFARDYDEVIRSVPIDMIIAETDCPFVAPVPYRGKRNEPVFVVEVVKKLAEIRGEPVDTLAAAVLANTRRVFGLDVA